MSRWSCSGRLEKAKEIPGAVPKQRLRIPERSRVAVGLSKNIGKWRDGDNGYAPILLNTNTSRLAFTSNLHLDLLAATPVVFADVVPFHVAAPDRDSFLYSERYPSSQQPWATRQHYFRARHGLNRFARLTFLPTHVEIFLSVPTHVILPSARSSFQTHLAPTHTLSPPAFLHSPTESMPASSPPPSQGIIVPTPQVFEPRSPRLAQQQVHQSSPIPLSFVLAHVPRSRLPIIARVSKRFSTAAQLALYHTLDLFADACIAWLACGPHLAALVSTLALRAYPPAHGPSFVLALLRRGVALHDARHAYLPLTDTLPYAFFDDFLAAPARARITHLTLPHFIGVPRAAHEVPPAAVPRLAVLNSSPGLAVALVPGRPLRRVTLSIASTLYDGLRPAAPFGALGGALKELVLVLAPDVDVHMRWRLLGALGNTGAGLEMNWAWMALQMRYAFAALLYTTCL
ncbi:hypothetical protein H4582DRAFT_2089506 [Lactarius indigo]|nr:hypothetical protein H4582DRAFT_2089506 [Lactarius indigo]